MLRPLDPGEFIQGTIFTCGLSEAYPNVTVFGMIITARCDTVQDKANVYNYIPIVPVEAWIEKDGLELVAKRALADGIGAMKSALSDAGMAPSIIDFVESTEILNKLKMGTTKHEAKIAERFEVALRSVMSARMVLENKNLSTMSSLSFIDENEKLYKNLIRELMTNALSEFHYIERVSAKEKTRGYVALMREIRFISAALGKQIAVGLDVEEFNLLSKTLLPGLNHIRFSEEHDFAMPLSCIASPYIEFIMQRFTNLFSRIGVTDIPKARITEAHSWVKIMQRTVK